MPVIEVISPKRAQEYTLARIRVEIVKTGRFSHAGKNLLQAEGGEEDTFLVLLQKADAPAVRAHVEAKMFPPKI